VFWWGELRKRDHLEDVEVDGRIVLRWIFTRSGRYGTDWIDLAHDRNRWQALVNVVRRLWFP
jgi:hypothetical protein